MAHLGAAIGIQHPTRLRVELHSMLVYGKGQFFAAHQDSERHDDMVATLVLALPSKHTGGELVVHGRDGAQEYAASREELSLVVFYPDRHHEVLPVRTGHRITLTFNVLQEGVSDVTLDGPVEQATALLRAHFSTAITSPYSDKSETPTAWPSCSTTNTAAAD
ncbi:2OG-Fe(II) oxygenase [Ornithinimicrobium ciconiae]|uniref:2OG-Fe(II) oxygenase n=1 Tax=Ornithinimicrobium ciconiae TaxID=2594265 RepID=A0A516GDW0_9MICO|nr:2OG-Fe(II) oxygenase [Ornithinimicrobium ciconiae]QDO89530.1 2OG-Fe(II) oxygenase [Ornithinimicrobium ciconiae]